MSLLAVDMGSSSCKAVVFSEDGHTLAEKICSYPTLQRPHPSWAETSAETFWQAFTSATQSVSAKVPADPVEVLAISSHGESFVPVDAHNQPIAPAILNIDNRATSEAHFVAEKLGRKLIFEITGQTAHPMYPLAKMLWLRRRQSNMFSAAKRFLAVPTYILTRLGLPAYVDYSLASRYLTFDIHKLSWSSEILSTFDLLPEQLPAAVPAGTVAGELSTGMGAELGLRLGTLIVVGGHDQPCGALGCGVLEPGRVFASLGTYECLVTASHKPVLSDPALAANLNSYCHVVPQRYVTLAYFPAGIMLDWFLRALGPEDARVETNIGELCRRMEAQASEDPSGLCITPHLFGTCNPDFDPQATGVIAGIRPGTSRADLYKGILEGIACEFANMSDLLQATAGAFREVHVSGGGTASPFGLKLRASLSGCELQLMDCPDSVCLGTAMLAGLAAGKYGCFCEASEQLVRVGETVEPDQALAKRYKQQRQQYGLLYSSLAPLRRAQGELRQGAE
ncbi:MAG TPA: FGGY-family carbohydrate kinase [Terriglobales bacterium]